MAFIVDSMVKNKDLEGLKKLLMEARETQSRVWLKKKYLYMEQAILVIKQAIQKVEEEQGRN